MDKGFLTVIPQDIMDKAGEIGLGLVLQAVGHTVCVHLSCTWFWSNQGRFIVAESVKSPGREVVVSVGSGLLGQPVKNPPERGVLSKKGCGMRESGS